MAECDSGQLELMARKSFRENHELVKVVDFLNKTLKGEKIMFGLAKDQEKGEMNISIYRI